MMPPSYARITPTTALGVEEGGQGPAIESLIAEMLTSLETVGS
jgi:hypothetical protein